MTDSDDLFMREALREAEKAAADGEVPVGAVAVKDGLIIARGRNAAISDCDPTAHAEMKILRRAARHLGNYRLSGVCVYVTLEPCLMCYAAMVHARIERLVFGAHDPKTGVVSTGALERVAAVFNHAVLLEGGCLRAQCSKIVRDFFKVRRGAGAVERGGLENR
ncbi:MAG TPA: nucleoside deaminase [Candidatus Aminicenantes bacterium]|nr:nucleoside deaminase [Candidatus Aminicenantes bacterium]